MSSTRLPGKVLAPIGGKPSILFMIDRLKRARRLDRVVVATSVHASDNPLVAALKEAGVTVIRGDLDDVLSRYVLAAHETGADIVVRLTGDCPLIDPAIVDRVVSALIDSGADYASNVEPPTYADGLDTEAFTADLLGRAAVMAVPGPEREHVTLWMRSDRSAARRVAIRSLVDSSHLRLTVDHPADLQIVRRLVDALGDVSAAADHYDMLRCIDRDPGLLVNAVFARNEMLAG